MLLNKGNKVESEFETRYEVRLNLRGIFGRNRTSKFTSLTLQKDLVDKPDPWQASQLVWEKIKDLKIKTGIVKAFINAYQYREDGNMVSRTILPFNQQEIVSHTIS